MATKDKRKGVGLAMKTFEGSDGTYLVVWSPVAGSYHVFKEVEAKEAARKCGSKRASGNTRQYWSDLWK